mmetsp:Transcript_47154/g.50953  ORF Transcript_47154/g.50953 Transcript_47154/m.50953 type:complete len:178 (-) Transcript_47154:182-715(-)
MVRTRRSRNKFQGKEEKEKKSTSIEQEKDRSEGKTENENDNDPVESFKEEENNAEESDDDDDDDKDDDDDNNNNNNNNNGGISEVCEKLYEESVKCEKNVAGASYKDTSGCEMIHKILPKLNSAMKNIRSPPIAKVAAWTFGIGFFALAGYLFLLHKKVARQKQELQMSGYCDGIPA